MAPRPDMSLYFLTHNALRQEFGLLARAAKSVRNDAHRELIEDQIALATDVLRSHHREEDSWLFPTLVNRLPESEPGIAGLLEDHTALDELITDVAGTSKSLDERAFALNDLHHLLNEHIEREERDVVPLVQQTITEVEWDQSVHRPLNALTRDRLQLAFGWLASANEPQQMKRALNSMPILERALFKVNWWPAYQKRFEELYSARPAAGATPTKATS